MDAINQFQCLLTKFQMIVPILLKTCRILEIATDKIREYKKAAPIWCRSSYSSVFTHCVSLDVPDTAIHSRQQRKVLWSVFG